MIELLGFTIPLALVKAAEVLGIIVIGLVVTRLLVIAASPVTKKSAMIRVTIKTLEYLLIISTVFLAVFFLDPQLTQSMLRNLGDHIPIIISTTLLLILGVMLVNLLMELLNVLFTGIMLQQYLKKAGIDESLLKILLMGVQLVLYIIVLQVSLTQLGIPAAITESVLSAISYALALLVIALAFVASREMVKNWLAGFYLKSSKFIKMGQRIFVDDADGEVVHMSSFSTLVDTGKGYFVAIPHAKIIDNGLRIKKSRFELKTLESVRRHYTAQQKSYCVPAVIDIILTLFGYPVAGGQDEVAKVAKTKVPGGTTARDAMAAVSQLTGGDVQGLLVPHKDILNLKDEIKAWLAEGALVVANFYKAALFPGVKREQTHAVLCLGIEGDELLIMDPNASTGGVYLVHYKDMERAMGPFEGEERGFIAYAPRGTKAFWRVQNKLYYSDPVHYKRLSKALERKLKQVFREASKISDVFPEYLREYLDEFKTAESEQIQRLWKP